MSSPAANCPVTPPTAESLDPNMKVVQPKDDLIWHDLREFTIEGRGWEDVTRYYSRLPDRAQGKVRAPVWDLSQRSAGICARFVTDSPKISACWTLLREQLAMDHMPATGVSGLDLYVRHEGRWRWLGLGRPTKSPTNTAELVAHLPPGRREFLLYLPLYNGVEQVRIGIKAEHSIEPAPPRPPGRRRPICYYGTSIVMGGCASRPGMCHAAILGRKLDWPMLNLGFSGNGQLEPEVGEFLAELDPQLYMLDCNPNLQADQITERLEPMIRRLRAARPQTPIVLVEGVVYTQSYLVGHRRDRCMGSNAAHRAIFEKLKDSGMENLFNVPGETLLDPAGEGTVDGTHPTDVGFVHMADAIEPVLRRALNL
jgi:lysophospholipase L1-like esterase